MPLSNERKQQAVWLIPAWRRTNRLGCAIGTCLSDSNGDSLLNARQQLAGYERRVFQNNSYKVHLSCCSHFELPKLPQLPINRCISIETVFGHMAGLGERGMELMAARAASRVAFGKAVSQQGAFVKELAQHRIQLDAARLDPPR